MWAPITETLNLGHIHGASLLFPSIALFAIGLIKAICDDRIKIQIFFLLIAIIGCIGISECIASAANQPGKDRLYPVFMVNTYPVEYRPENNRLYVFKDNYYHPVSNFTNEYVNKDDTLFEYHYFELGNNLYWGRGMFTSLKRLDNIVWYDSLNAQKIMTPETITLELNEDGFLESKNTPLENDSSSID